MLTKPSHFLFFRKCFGGHIHMSYFVVTGTPVLNFWWCLHWVSKPEWVLPYSLFCRGECNVHYLRSTYGATLADLLMTKPTLEGPQQLDLHSLLTGIANYIQITEHNTYMFEHAIFDLVVTFDLSAPDMVWPSFTLLYINSSTSLVAVRVILVTSKIRRSL